MTMVTGEADSARQPRAMRSDLLRQIWINRADYLYVLPAIVVMLIVIAYPIYYTVDLSFFKTPPGLQLKDKSFVGLDNYTAILTSDVFWRVTLNTVIWTLASTVHRIRAGLCLGAGAASRLLRARHAARHLHHPVGDQRGRRLLYLEMDLPLGFRHHRRGARADWGSPDRPPNFIDSVSTVLPSLIVVNIWREFPFAMIMMMAGLQTVPEQLLRAAQVDGASAWQRFWHVTFPHLRGVSTVTVLLLAVANFNSFIIPWIMTGGGPSNASHIWITHIYELAFGRQRWGVASAYSVLLFFILMTLGYFYVRALSQRRTKGARGMTRRRDCLDAPPQADRWLALGRPLLPAVHAPLYRRADGLDVADIDQVGLRGHGVSARVVAERANAGELPESARSPEQRRPGLPAIFLEQPVRFDPDHDPRRYWSRCRLPTPSRASVFRDGGSCSSRCCCATCSRR